MEIVCANEEVYLNELVAYQLQFEGYKYDWFNNKLVKVPINVSQKFSPMEATIIATSSQSEHVVTTIDKPKSIKGRAKLTIVSCTLSLPIESMEVPIVVNT